MVIHMSLYQIMAIAIHLIFVFRQNPPLLQLLFPRSLLSNLVDLMVMIVISY